MWDLLVGIHVRSKVWHFDSESDESRTAKQADAVSMEWKTRLQMLAVPECQGLG